MFGVASAAVIAVIVLFAVAVVETMAQSFSMTFFIIQLGVVFTNSSPG